MTGLELLEKYPLTAKIVRDWFMKSMLESFKDEDVPEEFKQFMLEQGIENDKVAKLIDVNVRILFDVFDENKLYVHIIPVITEKEKMSFLVGIDTFEGLDDTPSTPYSSRREAEHAVIEKAFEILETKLTLIDLPALGEIEVTGEEIVEE